MIEIDRDIINNSEYIIQFYKEKDKKITNLELQKLAYFLEAIYMVCEDDSHLYNEDFSAWNFGPVNLVIYNKYKKFGNLPIDLEENIEINPINKKYIENLYNLFKDFNATQLVNLSHSKGSPWYEIYSENDGKIPRNEIIDKKSTKKWFSNLVVKTDE